MNRTLLTLLVLLGMGCAGINLGSEPERVVRAAFEADTPEEMLPYLRFPERIQPHLEENKKEREAKGEPPPDRNVIRATAKTDLDQVPECGWIIVEVEGEMTIGGKSQRQTFNVDVQKTPGGFKLDWESSSGHNDMPLKVFKATMPLDPVTMRVIAEIDDYYNYEYEHSQNTHYSIKMFTYEKGGESLHGYIHKASDAGEQLYEILKDGEEHKVTLALHYHPDSYGRSFPVNRDSSTATIWSLIATDWVIDRSNCPGRVNLPRAKPLPGSAP